MEAVANAEGWPGFCLLSSVPTLEVATVQAWEAIEQYVGMYQCTEGSPSRHVNDFRSKSNKATINARGRAHMGMVPHMIDNARRKSP